MGSTAGDESPIQFGMETLSWISGGTSVYPTDTEMSLYLSRWDNCRGDSEKNGQPTNIVYAISYVQVLKSSRWLPFVQLPEMNITILQFPFDDIQNSQSNLSYRTSVPVTGKMEGVVRMIGFHALGYHMVLLCHINCECMRCAGSTYKHDNGMNKPGPHFLTYRRVATEESP